MLREALAQHPRKSNRSLRSKMEKPISQKKCGLLAVSKRVSPACVSHHRQQRRTSVSTAPWKRPPPTTHHLGCPPPQRGGPGIAPGGVGIFDWDFGASGDVLLREALAQHPRKCNRILRSKMEKPISQKKCGLLAVSKRIIPASVSENRAANDTDIRTAPGQRAPPTTHHLGCPPHQRGGPGIAPGGVGIFDR